MEGRRMVKVYTRSGDDGYTHLPAFKGMRIAKDHPVLEVLGTIDELDSFIGFARSLARDIEELSDLCRDLELIQRKLFCLCSMVAGCGDRARVSDDDVKWLEERIDRMLNEVELRWFVLPGGHPVAAALHVARTVCRRLERRLVALKRLMPSFMEDVVLRYVNRLSDYLFVAALYVNRKLGVPEEEVKP